MKLVAPPKRSVSSCSSALNQSFSSFSPSPAINGTSIRTRFLARRNREHHLWSVMRGSKILRDGTQRLAPKNLEDDFLVVGLAFG